MAPNVYFLKNKMGLPDNLYSQKFIQKFMWKKVCRDCDVVEMYNDCLIKNDDEEESSVLQERTKWESPELMENVLAAINSVNARLEPIHLRIAKGYDEKSGEACYVFSSTNTSDLPKFQTMYSKQELNFFRKLMACIVTSGEGKVSHTTALNLSSELERKVSKEQVQMLINRFCMDMWLVDENGSLSLSNRTRLEFAPYLRSEFEDFLAICICKDVILQYFEVCSECQMKMHRHCLNRYFKEVKEKNCPKCHEPWNEENGND